MIKLINKHNDSTIKVFFKKIGLSQRTITNLSKELGLMKINGKAKIMTDIIKKGQSLELNLKDENSTTNIPKSNGKLKIIYEDEYLLIVDKPINLPTIPSYNYKDNLASQVISYLNNCVFRAMNRLDADTTGCVLIVKDVITENLLRYNGRIYKEYVAIVNGKINKKGIIDSNIKDNETLKKRVVSEDGLPAITYYKKLKYVKNNDVSIIKCNLKYGRTNQIRCHLASINHPLTNDNKYSNLSNTGKSFYLRCYKLIFVHPYTNRKIKIKLPLKLKDYLKKI